MSQDLRYASDCIQRVNFVDMPTVTLTKWIRDHTANPDLERPKMSITHALSVAYMLQEVYKLGEIRGRSVR